MNKPLFLAGLILAFFLAIPLAVFAGDAEPVINQNVCENGSSSRLIYAQDIGGVTPLRGNESAIINDRFGNTLVIIRQIDDWHVVWPSTVLVPLINSDTLHYRSVITNESQSHYHFLTVDLLDSNKNFIQKLSWGYQGNIDPNFVLPQNSGFLRFNAGSQASQYNALFLCPFQASVPPIYNNPTNNNTVNRSPVWNQAPYQTVYATQNTQFSVYASDYDNDTLNYSTSNLPPGASFDSNSKIFNWTPNNNQVGNYTVNFRVSDGHNPPVDMYGSINVIANNNYNNNSYYYHNSYDPFPYNWGNGNYNYNNYQYTGYAGYTGYTGSYPYGYNRPPVWNQVSSQVIFLAQTLQFSVSAADPDTDYLVYSATNLPLNARFDNVTHIFTWTPINNQTGFFTPTFVVTDGKNAPVDMVVPITVSPNQVVYVPPVVYTTPVTPSPTPVVITEKLSILSFDAKAQASGDVVFTWITNKPSTSKIIYDTVSKVDRSDQTYNYSNATAEDGQLVTSHLVTLSQIEINKTYFLRLVSKTSDELAVSKEVILVKGTATNSNYFANTNFSASALGNLLVSPWLLLLVIIILLILLIREYRRTPVV